MKKNMVILAAALVLIAGVAASYALSGLNKAGGASKEGNNSASVITIDEKTNGKTIDITKGKQLKIVLKSNPSTGFDWSYDKSPNSTILKELEMKYESDSDLPGAPGKDIFLYDTLSAGSTEILLKYSQSWEKVKPEKTYKIKVNVTSSSE